MGMMGLNLSTEDNLMKRHDIQANDCFFFHKQMSMQNNKMKKHGISTDIFLTQKVSVSDI